MYSYNDFRSMHLAAQPLQTLRVTPAMEAGVANHVWSIEDIASC